MPKYYLYRYPEAYRTFAEKTLAEWYGPFSDEAKAEHSALSDDEDIP